MAFSLKLWHRKVKLGRFFRVPICSLLHHQTFSLALILSACTEPDNSTPKPIDYFSGTWEADINGGKIRLVYLPEGKFRIQWISSNPSEDSVFSDLI